MTYLKKISIYNMWGEKTITLPLNKDITILTGYNGSGKSTLLNIIFDSLVKLKKKKIPTSSQRFWASKLYFSTGEKHCYACLPQSNEVKADEIINLMDNSKDGIFSYSGMKIAEKEYNKSSKISSKIKFSVFKEKNFGTLDIYSQDGNDNLDYNPFIYQDEKKSLHKKEDINYLDKNIYWGNLDERISHIKTKLYNKKSKLNKEFTDNVSSINIPDNDEDFSHLFMSFLNRHKREVDEFIYFEKIINKYLEMTNKIIQYDKDGNIYVSYINKPSISMWHELSRGEKTLIYILMVVFLYKDNIKIFILDEPDVSLHIDWQDTLLSDLLKLAPNTQFIIATHSPALISDGWLEKAIYVDVINENSK